MQRFLVRVIINAVALWLTPLIVMLILMGALLVAGGSGLLAPFIYALF